MKNKMNESKEISRRSFLTGAAAIGAVSAMGFAGCASEEASDNNASSTSSTSEGNRVTYTGSGAGRMGDIMVKVELDDTTITSVNVYKHHESPLIADSALTRIPQLVVKNQSVDFDAVSGATITSAGLRAAINDALEQAGLSAHDLAQTGSEAGVIVEEPIEDAVVAVIGGGLSGMTCAARLLQNGVKTVLFEETAHVGGSSCVSDGWITGAGIQMQKEQGVEDSPELFYEFLSKDGNDPAIIPYPEITKEFSVKAGEVMDWLDRYVNVDFGDRIGGNGLYVPPNVPRIYGVNSGGAGLGRTLIQLIQNDIQAGNASIVLEARATNLLQDDSGAVTGVEITYADGTVKEYNYQAVVLCTGGYSHNEELLPYENCGSCSPSTASGHGFELAKNAGALLDMTQVAPAYAGGIPNAGFEMRYEHNFSGFKGALWINQEGTRMANEDISLLAKAAWQNASNNIAFFVFSEAQRVDYLRPIKLTSYLEGELTPWQSWNILDEFIEKGEVAFKADTVEELADLAGIDGTALAATIEAYNGYCDAGVDPDFERKGLQKLEGALYAIKGIPYQLQTGGGVRITAKAEALDTNENVISGLYIGGETVGMKQSSGASQGGCGLGTAATWGYVAADSASEYVG